jgi:hypothetical protein
MDMKEKLQPFAREPGWSRQWGPAAVVGQCLQQDARAGVRHRPPSFVAP